MLRLSADARAGMERWVRAGYPHETCGVLVGREENGLSHVLRAVQARNRNDERSRDRYDLDPGDFVAADLGARSQGLAIVGIWHSHPDHPAEPSETDHAAAWEGWSYLILSVSARGVDALRSWRLSDGRFREERLKPMSRGAEADPRDPVDRLAGDPPERGQPDAGLSYPLPRRCPPGLALPSVPPRIHP